VELFRLPFFEKMDEAQTVLIAGAGGGYDIFAGLPLYFALTKAGKTVHLANLSFSRLEESTAEILDEALVKVTAQTQGNIHYFPELYLARWFERIRSETVPIYCFAQTGVLPITTAYRTLLTHLGNVDTIVLVDGGTDILMRGDEFGLGTPQEDVASLAAVDAQEGIARKLLLCLGFGIDTYHGVCHAHFLEAVADLTRHHGFLGAWTLIEQMPEVQLYREAVEYVHRNMPASPSIVNASILSALEGHFGNYHATNRTTHSELFINTLMSLYWCFDLSAVAKRNLYIDQVRQTASYWELTAKIERFRMELGDGVKPWKDLPM
jgi:hypothetical protein